MQNGASPDGKIGRIRAAWLVLLGQRVTPQQIVADWIEYQQIFNDLLDRWSAKLARDAKAEKERIKRLDQAVQQQQHIPQSPPDTKAELRKRVASLRGFSILPNEVKHEPASEGSKVAKSG